jgi:hypothetical protein
MGFFTRTRNLPTQSPSEEAISGELMPRAGTSIANKATEVYKQHPKLIGGLALIASAVLLNRMKRPH